MMDPRVRMGLLVVTVLLVQLTLLTHVRVFGVMPDAMLLLAIAAGLTGGPIVGSIVGFCSGMAIDLFLQTPMGLSALVFSIVGYVVGLLQASVLRTAWWIPPLSVLVASAVAETLFAMAGAVLGERQMVSSRLIVVVMVVAVTNAVLAVVVIRLVQWATATLPTRGAYAR